MVFKITDDTDVRPKGKLGLPGSPEHAKFVTDALERHRHYLASLSDVFQESEDYWDLYLNHRREFRGPGEEWRANIGVPEPFSAIEAGVASVVSILTGADPLIQPEAVHEEFLETAHSIERLLDYTFRKNHVNKMLTTLLRARDIQGTAFFKIMWEERKHTIYVPVTQEAMVSYAERLKETMDKTPGLPMPGAAWYEDPKLFEQWRQTVNISGRANLPPPPLSGEREIVQYRGPVFKKLSMYAVGLDPLVDEMSDQNFVSHRVVRPRAWLETQVKAGVYDGKAVEYALAGWDGERLSSEERSLAEKIGVSLGDSSDPQYANAVMLHEVWQPGTEIPYAVILNEKAVINKDPYQMPTWDGEVGVIGLRSLVIPGHFHGLSKLKQPKTLFEELNKLRNLRLDGATLNTLPIFTRLREVGIPDMLLHIQPGAIIPLSRADAIATLKRDPMPPEAWREPAEIKNEIADATGIYTQTKGAPAAIGRVTGTEFQGRANQAQLRIKLDAMFTEEDFVPVTRKIIMLWAQMSDDELRVKVGGRPDPMVNISREELLEALDIDWRFRGATKAINKEMQVQQLLTFVDKFGAVLKPAEVRYLSRLVLETLDLPSQQVITEKGTNEAQQDYDMARAVTMAQQQQQLAMMQMPPQQQGQPGQQPQPGQPQPQPSQPPPEGGQ